MFQEELLQCACGGRRKVTAFIPSGPIAKCQKRLDLVSALEPLGIIQRCDKRYRNDRPAQSPWTEGLWRWAETIAARA